MGQQQAQHNRGGGASRAPDPSCLPDDMTGIPAMPGQRNFEPARWAPHGFAAIPIPMATIDPPRRAASATVPALHGSRSPSAIVTTTVRKVVSGNGQVLSGERGNTPSSRKYAEGPEYPN